jgi:predicted AAA+ superfamily ATPase
VDPGGADVVHPLKAAGLADPHVASLAEVAERRAGYRFAYGRGASASAPRPRLLESTDEDTLVGYQLPAYQTTASRKPVATAKLYPFDVDVANTLRRAGSVEPGSDAYVRALEHLVFLELRSFLDCRRRDEPLCYWRSRSQFEVDFVVGERVAIEVKAKPRVTTRDSKGLLG